MKFNPPGWTVQAVVLIGAVAILAAALTLLWAVTRIPLP